MGACGRLFFKSVLVGVVSLSEIGKQHDAVCKWHLNGFIRKSSDSVRLYLGVAALAGRVTESTLLELMQDDRFFVSCRHTVGWT